MEGKDDMPAHLKSSIIGPSLNIPSINMFTTIVRNGELCLGTWQVNFLFNAREFCFANSEQISKRGLL